MKMLQTFKEFAEALPVERHPEVEAALSDLLIQLSNPEGGELSKDQEAELDRRLADPNPTVVPADEIFAEFGRRMPRG